METTLCSFTVTVTSTLPFRPNLIDKKLVYSTVECGQKKSRYPVQSKTCFGHLNQDTFPGSPQCSHLGFHSTCMTEEHYVLYNTVFIILGYATRIGKSASKLLQPWVRGGGGVYVPYVDNLSARTLVSSSMTAHSPR